MKEENYFVIVSFRDKAAMEKELKMQGDRIEDIKDIKEADGKSLLEAALGSGKFEMASYILAQRPRLNVVSKEGYNELHFLAARSREKGGAELAEQLLEKGVSLDQADKRYGKTPLWYFCQEYHKRGGEVLYSFLEKCFAQAPDVDRPNKAGYTLRQMIEQGERPELLRWIERKDAK